MAASRVVERRANTISGETSSSGRENKLNHDSSRPYTKKSRTSGQIATYPGTIRSITCVHRTTVMIIVLRNIPDEARQS